MSGSGDGGAGEERVRLVVLGGAGVGKSAIVKRFLHNTYCDRYRSTVEDLYSRDFQLGDSTLKVDILDTAGDQQFPAMRRLSIATASAFLLVYAASSRASYDAARACMAELRAQRADLRHVPVVLAGNKSDLARTRREVELADVSDWLHSELPRTRVKVLECSAREDTGVRELFRALLLLGRPEAAPDPALKRRSSAYVSATSKGKGRAASGGTAAESASETTPPVKPRSRSLIRRTSRKNKPAPAQGPDDCRAQ